MDYANLRPKFNCKQCRSVTVSDQRGQITRGKTNIRVAQPCADCLFPVCITPQNTGCLYIQCDKTSSILNFCFCGCWGGGEQGWGMGVGGDRRAPGSGLTEERLTQPQPLRSMTVCLQDSMQPSAGSPPPTLQTLHPSPHPDTAITTDNATS